MTAIQEDKVWHDFFYTELTTGLRRGEICGLMWQDFDEAHGTLTVRRTIHAERGGRLTAGETKTGAGKRIITLPPSTAQLLSERRKRSYTEWIFPDPLRPERPTRPNAAYVRMKELLKKAGLPSIRFHDLRHPYVKTRTKIFQNFLAFSLEFCPLWGVFYFLALFKSKAFTLRSISPSEIV